MNVRDTPRSLVTPIVLAVTGLALAGCLLLYLATLAVVRADANAKLAQAVDVELAALADIHATGGRDEVAARIADRLAMQPRGIDAAHYMLADGSGRRIAGDIASWPLLSAENSQAGFVTIGGGVPVYARATQLGPGLRAVAAREYGARDALIGAIGRAFALAAGTIALAAAGVAWWIAARLRRRVANLNAALDTIRSDTPAAAIPHLDDRDEIGALARHAARLVGRLDAALRSQRAITDQVAHEVRTPLAHLDGRLLRMIDASDDQAQIAALAAVRGEARGVAELLDSLLDIASSEARRSDRTGLERVDLSAIVANVVELYADSAEELGFELSATVEPGVTIAGDAMQLTRMLSNLLDNAFKYAGAGARITIELAPGPVLTVTDDGPGVPAALHDTMFEPFRRAGPGPGHGLGLALVRAIAQRHGLTIRHEDAQPGARFVIEGE